MLSWHKRCRISRKEQSFRCKKHRRSQEKNPNRKGNFLPQRCHIQFCRRSLQCRKNPRFQYRNGKTDEQKAACRFPPDRNLDFCQLSGFIPFIPDPVNITPESSRWWCSCPLRCAPAVQRPRPFSPRRTAHPRPCGLQRILSGFLR